MNLTIPHSLLTQYLDTPASPKQIAEWLSLCGPTVDHLVTTPTDFGYDVEIISNRVDCASAFGLAREAVAILPQFKTPAAIKNDPFSLTLKALGKLPETPPVKVKITDINLVPRFTCIALTNIHLAPSPQLVRDQLTLSHQRPLSNVIDITNELTLRYGQPVHIFDLDLITHRKMLVRLSHPGEKILTLDGKTHTLPGNDIVIEDGAGRLIDLCGIMGGGLSAVSAKTKNVLLFVQTYDPQKIRRTSLHVQERTLAAQLFEKKPDPEMVLPVLIEGVKLLQERAQASISSTILDLYPKPYPTTTVNLDPRWLAQFAGVAIPVSQITQILNRLGIQTSNQSNQIICRIPSHRATDLATPPDIAEEIMRIYGYFRLPSVLPANTLPHTQTPPLLSAERDARTFLANLGLTEVYNNSLISKNLADQAGIALKNTFRLQNPFSSDYEYMRPSLLLSLLANLSHNRGQTFPTIQLFELANCYFPQKHSPLASETSTLSAIFWGLSYPQIKGYLEALSRMFHLHLDYVPTTATPSPFSPKYTAKLSLNGQVIGFIGQVDTTIAARFELKPNPYIFELNFDHFSQARRQTSIFQPVPPHPPIIEDLTFTLKPQTYVGPLLTTLRPLDPRIVSVTLKDVFNQNYTFTLAYNHQTPLTAKTIAPLRHLIVKTLKDMFGANLVGELI